MAKRKKGFYDHLVDWSEKIAMALCGCNGNELLVHILLKMRFIKHKMQVRVDMPEIARNSKYIIVDFVIPNHKGQEIWMMVLIMTQWGAMVQNNLILISNNVVTECKRSIAKLMEYV